MFAPSPATAADAINFTSSLETDDSPSSPASVHASPPQTDSFSETTAAGLNGHFLPRVKQRQNETEADPVPLLPLPRVARDGIPEVGAGAKAGLLDEWNGHGCGGGFDERKSKCS
ncbi:hypothetical protein MSAN_01892700 [Mycena sanguinolenta]|uniref:Uncharacterized protein n=1 Tax=Mycena sanguinolenta TaxID=230812 RepID=A0A8H6XR11_9AGAR|nr:hypothetical protein MSAN_01892700 [Mycena sanguinolenta]